MFDIMLRQITEQRRKANRERQSIEVARRRKRTCRDIDSLTDLGEVNKYFAGILDGNIDSFQDNIPNGPLDPDSDGDFFVRVHINGVDLFGQSFSGDGLHP